MLPSKMKMTQGSSLKALCPRLLGLEKPLYTYPCIHICNVIVPDRMLETAQMSG